MIGRSPGRTAGVVLLMVFALAGCSTASGGPAAQTTSSAPATYPLDPRPVRPDEKPLRLPAAVAGDTSFSLIGLTTGVASLVGSHVEFNAVKGQFIRIRLVITNVGRSSVLFDTRRQTLVFADGSTATPDDGAMQAKRQPDKFDLGAAVRVEFDLYYDVPKDAKAVALRVHGGPTLTDMNDEKGTDIRLS